MAATGTGWINVEPIIEEEHEPPAPGPFAFLGGSTHQVPTVTWMPGKRLANGTTRPTTIGLQHASGPHLAWKLADLGLPLPEGWRVTQDHPRRGLVALVPADVAPRHGDGLAAGTGRCGLYRPGHRSLGGVGPRRSTLGAGRLRPADDRPPTAAAVGEVAGPWRRQS